MDNLLKDPLPQVPVADDNNVSSRHSTYTEVAQHKLRDSHGKFATDYVSQNPDLANAINPPNIFKKIWRYMTKLSIKKILAILAFSSLTVSNPFFQNLVAYYFPNSSPVLGRTISYQGILKSSQSGIYSLVLPDQQTYTIHFKPTTSLTNLKKLNEVVVKGNLTWTPYVIENAEVYPLNLSAGDFSPVPDESQVSRTPNPVPSGTEPLPSLFSNLKWEVAQTKVLTFTSGKRRIEQEGVYLESSIVTDYPQDFMSYYSSQLANLGFKQTLNSFEPNGTTITYSKDDLFLTFGVKNVYQGSGDSKKLVGYKAFIEHN